MSEQEKYGPFIKEESILIKPNGIIDQFLSTEEFLLAQLKWIYEKYLAILEYRDAYYIYEDISKQCKETTITTEYTICMIESFKNKGLNLYIEYDKYWQYKKIWNDYLKAANAYNDFLVKKDRTIPQI